MSIVMLLDQQESRRRDDLVDQWRERLNQRYELLLPFTRTTGDEMQAVLGEDTLGGVLREVLRSGEWWIGIGIGEIERPLPDDTREGRGPAFWNARQAIERAKGRRRGRPAAIVADEEIGARLEQCVSGLAYVINRRTPAQRAAAREYAEAEGSVQRVAERLGISVQGARKNVLAAGCEEEAALASLADWIVRPAVDR
jgi:hypothetical protein